MTSSNNESMLLRVGTRNSVLAVTQTNVIIDTIRRNHNADQQLLDIRTVEIASHGDKVLNVPLSKLSSTTKLDKGVFTKELELALLNGGKADGDQEEDGTFKIDLAVHSLKDLPTVLPLGMRLAAIGERHDPYDALVLPLKKGSSEHEGAVQAKVHSLDELRSVLPERCRIGTSSLRRKAQLLRLFPDANVIDVRGNLQTRLRKLDDGQYDALVLASAGLSRLGLEERASYVFSGDEMMYAVSQGALGVECRECDQQTYDLLQRTVHHLHSACICMAERSLLRELEGGCSVPLGVYTETTTDEETNQEKLLLHAGAFSLDGTRAITDTMSDVVSTEEDAIALGRRLAQRLREKGAMDILAEAQFQ